ncbi:MAG: hypothetical protein ACR2F6_13415 [Mycobacteriales bacterium]
MLAQPTIEDADRYLVDGYARISALRHLGSTRASAIVQTVPPM